MKSVRAIFQLIVVAAMAALVMGVPAAAETCGPNADTGANASNGEKIHGANWRAQTFEVTGSGCFVLKQITFSARQAGSPQNLVVEIRTVTGEPPVPGATVLASETINSGISTSFADITVQFSSPPQIAGGVKYALVLHQLNNGGNGSNYYGLGYSGNNPYLPGRYCKWNESNSSWDCPGSNAEGNPASLDARMSIYVCDCASGCTYSQGYWKNHPSEWPADGLTLGNVYYTDEQLLYIFHQAVVGNGLVSLAHQLIAALLNEANGAIVPSAVADAIASAQALIGDKVVPPLGSDFVHPRETGGLTGTLDLYNNGQFAGAPHCAEQD